MTTPHSQSVQWYRLQVIGEPFPLAARRQRPQHTAAWHASATQEADGHAWRVGGVRLARITAPPPSSPPPCTPCSSSVLLLLLLVIVLLLLFLLLKSWLLRAPDDQPPRHGLGVDHACFLQRWDGGLCVCVCSCVRRAVRTHDTHGRQSARDAKERRRRLTSMEWSDGGHTRGHTG